MQALLVCDMPEAGTTSPGHTCCHAHCCQAHCPALTLQSQGIAGFNRNYPENRENTACSAACTFTPSELAVAPVGFTIPCYESTTLALLAGAGWTEKPSDEHKVQKREGFAPNSSLLVLPVSLQVRFWASVSSNLASPQGNLSHVPETRLTLYVHLRSSDHRHYTRCSSEEGVPLPWAAGLGGRAEPQSSSQAGWNHGTTCSAMATLASPKRGGRAWVYQKELTATSWFSWSHKLLDA